MVLLGVIGFGLGTVFPLCTVCIQNAVPLPVMGTATGVMNFSRALNSALIVAVMGAIVLAGFGVTPERGRGAEALLTATTALGTDHAGLFRWVFAAAAGFMLIGLLALIRMEEWPLRGRAATPAKTSFPRTAAGGINRFLLSAHPRTRVRPELAFGPRCARTRCAGPSTGSSGDPANRAQCATRLAPVLRP